MKEILALVLSELKDVTHKIVLMWIRTEAEARRFIYSIVLNAQY